MIDKAQLLWIEATTTAINGCTRRMNQSTRLMIELKEIGGDDSTTYAFAELRYALFDFLGAVFVMLSGGKGKGRGE